MTGQMPTSHGRGIARSRLLAVAVLASLMVVAIGFVSPALAAADCPLPGANKTFAAEITPHSVAAGTLGQDFTLDLCNDSPVTTTQQLGSVNLTPPVGFLAKSINLPGCSTPIGMSGATCGDVVNNVVQIRNIKLQPALPPANQVSFTLKADVPTTCGDYFWNAKGRQSNNFQGAKNDFTLDTTDSDLKTTVTGCGPAPAPNLTVAFVDADGNVGNGVQRDAPDPVTSGETVSLKAAVDNTGTAAGTATYVHTVTGSVGGVVAFIGAPPGGGSDPCVSKSGVGTSQATCGLGSVDPSAPPIAVFVEVEVGTVTQSCANCTTHTGTIQGTGASDTESTSIDTAALKCIDPANGRTYDCSRTFFDPRRGMEISTSATQTPTEGDPIFTYLKVPANPNSTDPGFVFTLAETFHVGKCGGGTCNGTLENGNMASHGILPGDAVLGTGCGVQQCVYKLGYHSRLIPDGSPVTAQLLAEFFHEFDDGTGEQFFNCGSGNTDQFCRDRSADVLTLQTIVFTLKAGAGDGFTGSCLGSTRVCP